VSAVREAGSTLLDTAVRRAGLDVSLLRTADVGIRRSRTMKRLGQWVVQWTLFVPFAAWLVVVFTWFSWAHRGGRKCGPDCHCHDYV
jgi:hypothetical protein